LERNVNNAYVTSNRQFNRRISDLIGFGKASLQTDRVDTVKLKVLCSDALTLVDRGDAVQNKNEARG